MKRLWNSNAFRRVAYFFPIQLLFVHLKKNQALLIFWLILFGFISRTILSRYGVPFLFLNPEYLEKSGFLAYFFVGFSCGGFIMAFNISSYIINSFRFPFLATLTNPFLKYCLNNCLIPLAFLGLYSVQIYSFQHNEQINGGLETLVDLAGFHFGTFSFVFLSLSYFFRTNSDIYLMFGIRPSDSEDGRHGRVTRVALKRNLEWKRLTGRESRDWHVETYISNFRRIKVARDVGHYDKEVLHRVFRQNHRNAALFEWCVVGTLLLLGYFREVPFFALPAGSSIFLMFTMYLMLFSALHAWLRGWSTTVTLLILFVANILFRNPLIYPETRALGLDYHPKPAAYNDTVLHKLSHADSIQQRDFAHTLGILDRWRLKNSQNSNQSGHKPKLILINTSGGGLRSALWTFCVLQRADSLTNGAFWSHTQLITGASGGMIGAAFFRELAWLEKQERIPNCHDQSLRRNMSRDLLNPVAFSMAVNDLFLRTRSVTIGNNRYKKDRGYAFEMALNNNTAHVMDKAIGEYAQPEAQSLMPMMILSPTVANDGRRMYISPQPVSYLTRYFDSDSITRVPLEDGIEFSRLLADHSPGNLRFTTALRMSASFPFVTPFISLPSEPTIELMDAGARDNFGLETTLKFLYTFRNWISSNTSGVVILQFRDRYKRIHADEGGPRTLMETFATPLNALYGNLFHIQDFNNDGLYQYASRWFDGKIEVLEFQLNNTLRDNISLSWHLTNREKRKVYESLEANENKASFKRLNELLEKR